MTEFTEAVNDNTDRISRNLLSHITLTISIILLTWFRLQNLMNMRFKIIYNPPGCWVDRYWTSDRANNDPPGDRTNSYLPDRRATHWTKNRTIFSSVRPCFGHSLRPFYNASLWLLGGGCVRFYGCVRWRFVSYLRVFQPFQSAHIKDVRRNYDNCTYCRYGVNICAERCCWILPQHDERACTKHIYRVVSVLVWRVWSSVHVCGHVSACYGVL